LARFFVFVIDWICLPAKQPERFIVSRNAEPLHLFVLTQFPQGKRYALFLELL